MKYLTLILLLLVPHVSYGWMWWIIGPNQDNTTLATEIKSKITKAEQSVIFAGKTVQILQSLGEMYALVENAKKSYNNLGNYQQRFQNLRHKKWAEMLNPKDPRFFSRLGIKPDTDSSWARSMQGILDSTNDTGSSWDQLDDINLTNSLRHIAGEAQEKSAEQARALTAEKIALAEHEKDMREGREDGASIEGDALLANVRDANVDNQKNKILIERTVANAQYNEAILAELKMRNSNKELLSKVSELDAP